MKLKEIGPALAYFSYKTDIVDSLSIEAPLILTLTAENFCEDEVRVKGECGGEWRQESYEQKFNNYYIIGKKRHTIYIHKCLVRTRISKEKLKFIYVYNRHNTQH